MTSSEPDRRQAEQFAAWVEDHGRAVRGYLLAIVRRKDVADDVLQEVFRRAWQSRVNYREEGHTRAYLLKIADRLVRDRHRQARPEITLDDEGWRNHEPLSRGNDDPQQAMTIRENVDQVNRAMKNLSSIQRRVLLKRYYGQMTFAEIAEEIGCPLGTVLSHCRRGLEKLRELLVEE